MKQQNQLFKTIEIIFDRDHGTDNRGWYARTTDMDGQECDDRITEDWGENPNEPEWEIRLWAMQYYAHPDGMNDEELAELRSMIAVRR